MNTVLLKMENYNPFNGPVWDANEAIDAGIEEIKRLLKIEKHRDILAMHMAEVKAVSDGKSENTLKEVIDHCLKEIKKLDL